MPGRRTAVLSALALASALVLAPPAQAAPKVKVIVKNGKLTVVGNERSQHIVVGRSGSKFTVKIGAKSFKPTSPATTTSVKGILVRGKGGDDVLTIDESGGAIPPATLKGGTGSDVIQGSSADDVMKGGPGDDQLRQSGGDDTMAGEQGDDSYLLDADGADVLLRLVEAAGGGTDLVSFAATTTTGVHVDLTDATQLVTPTLALGLSTPANFENLSGGSQDDILGGNSVVNHLTAGDGADTLEARPGDDVLTGGGGLDTFIHHGSADGIDTIADMSRDEGDQVSFETGGAVLAADLVLNSTATQLRDVATGTYGNDFTAPVLGVDTFYIFGTTDTSPTGQLITFNAPGGFGQGSNVDSLIASYATNGVSVGGAAGRDRIIDYSPNANSLVGRDGSDFLFGGDGADTLQGDRGFAPGVSDTYTGGAGADSFRFGEAFGGVATETFGADTVADFGDGADTVDLFTGLSVHSGLGTTTVTIWDGATDFGTITASNGHLWIAGDFS